MEGKVIEGFVNARYEARGSTGQASQIDVVIDTGFTEFLALPLSLVSDLELAFVGTSQLILANGSMDTFDVHRVSVRWGGRIREVEAHVSDGDALIGMRMLVGYNLNMDVEPGGRVTIRAKGDEERG